MTVLSRLWVAGAVLIAQLLLVGAASAKDDFLPPERAYRYTTRVEGDRVVVAWAIEPGYYLYKKKMGVVSAASSVQLGEPSWPKGEDHTDEYFGTQEIYRGKVEVPVPPPATPSTPESVFVNVSTLPLPVIVVDAVRPLYALELVARVIVGPP